jgi:hypothetical protein
MIVKRFVLLAIALFVVLMQGSASEPISLRLNWKPGERFPYKLDMKVDVRAAGETAEFRVQVPVTMFVKGSREGRDDPS